MSYTSGVTSSPLLHTLLRETDGAGEAKSARTGAAGVSAGKDTTVLSTAASVLQQAGAADTVRAKKVKSIQAAIASGSYNVSAGAVADKLITSLLQR